MELVVRKSDLLRELQFFQGIVERKTTLPVLANVLVQAEGESVELAATDTEVGLRSRCAAAVAKSGAVTLPAKKLYEIIKALPETDVRIEQDKSGVKVAAERFESRLSTLPRDEFPQLPDAGDAVATLPRDSFKHMVEKTQFAMTGEDTRYYLNGALFVLKPAQMTLVATDGHRLALVTVPREGGDATSSDDDDGVKVLLPRKTTLELSKLLGEGKEAIAYERSENHLFFRVEGRTLISRMMDAQFPAYERVIPKGNDKTVTFDRERINNAVRRVALLSNERSRAVKFQIAPGKVEVTSSSPEVGEAREELLVDYEGDALQICFNAQYVLDFLGAVESDTVSLALKDEASQALLKPVGVDGYDYTYVIMPMRI